MFRLSTTYIHEDQSINQIDHNYYTYGDAVVAWLESLMHIGLELSPGQEKYYQPINPTIFNNGIYLFTIEAIYDYV